MRSFPPIPEWVALEHQVAQVLTKQELHGWYFDSEAAWKLASSLRTELEETYQILRDRHPYVFGSEFTPKRNNKTSGYVEGCPFTKLKELNPTSRDHISWILQTFHGWKPKEMTPTGKPIIDEVILKEIGTPIAMSFLKCLDITKKLGMISEGTNAWLKLCTSANRIHHHCSVATNTHRCAHRKPNLAQCPSDYEFRQLFTASPGQVMVGADLSGIELRMLAHYLAKHDEGRYADILLNGDIHQVNADKIGSIDQRKIAVDSPHKALNYLLQSGAGVIAKRWLLINHENTKELCCSQLAFIHDELQFECDPMAADAVSASLVQSAKAAGEHYLLRLPISAEAKRGRNWSEVH